MKSKELFLMWLNKYAPNLKNIQISSLLLLLFSLLILLPDLVLKIKNHTLILTNFFPYLLIK